MKKSSLQQALLEAKEIEKSAMDNARKALEEELAPKIKQVANDALKEMEKQNLTEEEITIKISTDGEGHLGEPEVENSELSDEEGIEDGDIETLETDPETMGDEEFETDEESQLTDNNDEEMDETIFEITGLNEEGETPDMTNPQAPSAEPEMDAAPEGPATLDSIMSAIEDLNQKVDALSTEESSEHEGDSAEGEGDVAIIDDQPEAPAAPAQAPNAAPAPVADPNLQEDEYELDDEGVDEDVVYEMEDENMGETDEDIVYEMEDENADLEELNSDSIMEMFNELNNLDELEIIDEDGEEDEQEPEMSEDSQVVRHRAGQRGKIGKVALGKHAPHSDMASLNESIKKIKTQYVSKLDGLSKENESLKRTIKEYKESFVVLRKQINEVQIFNAKLAYANKLFTNGGLTNDDKIKIAEEFDKIETIDEAKKLYNSLLTEMKGSKTVAKNPAEKLRTTSPQVIKAANSQTLFESDEMRRMKRLAGISKIEE